MSVSQYRHTVDTPINPNPAEAVHYLTPRRGYRRACDVEGAFPRGTQHPALVSCAPCVESVDFRRDLAVDHYRFNA